MLSFFVVCIVFNIKQLHHNCPALKTQIPTKKWCFYEHSLWSTLKFTSPARISWRPDRNKRGARHDKLCLCIDQVYESNKISIHVTVLLLYMECIDCSMKASTFIAIVYRVHGYSIRVPRWMLTE